VSARTSLRDRVAILGLEIWLPVGLVVLWWALTRDGGSAFFPPLSEIWDSFRANWLFERVGSDLVPSVLLFVEGLLIASVAGVGLGLLLGLWSFGRRATGPSIDFFRSIPAPALISVMIILLGFGQTMKVAAISFAALFPVLLNTIDGVRGVNQVQIDVATAYRLRKRDRIVRVILPAASPQIFAGLRISLAVALAILVFSEMLAGTDGLGFFILYSQETYQIPAMWSGIVMLGLLGYVVNLIFVLMERRIMRWHRGWRATARETRRGA
jgi:ABC-type nitrate/sulfonate/bicarbonate transport system permease component